MTYESSLIALADPTRRQVFEALAAAPRSVGALADDFPVSRPAISQHLRVLSDAGLIHARSEGTRRVYSVHLQGLSDLRAYLDGFWTNALSEFAKEAEKEHQDDH